VRGGIVLSSDMNASSIGKQVLTTRSSRRRDHTDLSLREEADRPAITELVDSYAYCADRRDAASQMALFTEDTDFSSTWRLAIPFLPNTFGDGTRYHRYSTNSKPTKPIRTSTVKAPQCWMATTLLG
jgi:SnoaL-like domain